MMEDDAEPWHYLHRNQVQLNHVVILSYCFYCHLEYFSVIGLIQVQMACPSTIRKNVQKLTS